MIPLRNGVSLTVCFQKNALKKPYSFIFILLERDGLPIFGFIPQIPTQVEAAPDGRQELKWISASGVRDPSSWAWEWPSEAHTSRPLKRRVEKGSNLDVPIWHASVPSGVFISAPNVCPSPCFIDSHSPLPDLLGNSFVLPVLTVLTCLQIVHLSLLPAFQQEFSTLF